jgi:putative tricarboxylic transport membrane protein
MSGTLSLVTDPVSMMMFISALLLGLVFGAIPGLSGMTLAAVALPFTVYLSTDDAILFYAVVYVAGVYGGAITAILFNIPGSVENAPTALDGFPMTLKGQAGRAVGLAITSSALGGTFSCILLMMTSEVIARWAVEAIGPIEKFAMILFALSAVASIGGNSIVRRWISLFLGLFLAVIGTDPVGGLGRYSFGSYYIMTGISFAALLLGFFAVTEVLIQGERLITGRYTPPPFSIDFPRVAELWKMRFNIFRSAMIGFVCGVLPGVGSALGSFLSYTEAERWSKTGIASGKGNPDGVVASETANNAATAGAMIPLLGLGFPGGGYTAIMLSVFILHGLTPGPLVMSQQHDLVWLVFCGMFWASICIFLLGMLEARMVVQMLRIPFTILGPIILVLATIGAYSLRNNILDVWTLFLAGLTGYLLKQFGYPLPIIVMGFILGRLAETSFYQTMIITDYNPVKFAKYPVALFFLFLAVLTILLGFRKSDRSGSG